MTLSRPGLAEIPADGEQRVHRGHQLLPEKSRIAGALQCNGHDTAPKRALLQVFQELQKAPIRHRSQALDLLTINTRSYWFALNRATGIPAAAS